MYPLGQGRIVCGGRQVCVSGSCIEIWTDAEDLAILPVGVGDPGGGCIGLMRQDARVGGTEGSGLAGASFGDREAKMKEGKGCM